MVFKNYMHGVPVYPNYQINAVNMLSPYVDKVEDWLDLDLTKLALLAILVHGQTTTHRIARTFNEFLSSTNHNSVATTVARQMLERNKPIPELDGLTEEERKIVNKVIIYEHEAMILALDRDQNYQHVYQQLHPGAAVFASPLIWFRVENQANCYSYDQFIQALHQNDKVLQPYQQRYQIDVKLYQQYLKQMERFNKS